VDETERKGIDEVKEVEEIEEGNSRGCSSSDDGACCYRVLVRRERSFV